MDAGGANDSGINVSTTIPQRIRYLGVVNRTHPGSETALVYLLYNTAADLRGTCAFRLPSLDQVADDDFSMYYRMLLLCTYMQLYRRTYVCVSEDITTHVNGVFNFQHVIEQITSLVFEILCTILPIDNTYRGPFCSMIVTADALTLIGKRCRRVWTHSQTVQTAAMIADLGDTIEIHVGETVRAVNAIVHEFVIAPATDADTQLCESCGRTTTPTQVHLCAQCGGKYCSVEHHDRDRKYHQCNDNAHYREIRQVRALAVHNAGIVARALQRARGTPAETYADVLGDIMARLLTVHMHSEWSPNQRGMSALRDTASMLGVCLNAVGLSAQSYEHYYDAVERLCEAVTASSPSDAIKRTQFAVANIVSTK